MPQLDIVTYLSQFVWLLLSLIILYFIVTTWFIPSFKNNFIVRKSLKDLEEKSTSDIELSHNLKQLHILNTLVKL